MVLHPWIGHRWLDDSRLKSSAVYKEQSPWGSWGVRLLFRVLPWRNLWGPFLWVAFDRLLMLSGGAGIAKLVFSIFSLGLPLTHDRLLKPQR